jgi:hypothetical protein
MHTEFFNLHPRAEAYSRLNNVMASGTVCLQGAVCYVTEEGCRLLQDNIERYKLPGSFFIAGYNDVSAIHAINELCAQAPGKFYFHGVAREGSEDSEGHLLPGLMHAKLIYAEGDTDATVWVGSHNLTHNALRGVNIEAATITKGDKNDPFFQSIRKFLEATRRESFAGPAPVLSRPVLEKPVRELVLVHCEATEEQIRSIKERKNCYISIHLRQAAYDSLCRPPANPDKHVRLLLYPPGVLTSKGPTAPASVVKAAELYGVNFTEKSIRKGNNAGWPEMSYSIVEPAGDPFQPLKIGTNPHDPIDDVTVCAIRVDDELEEADEADNCCILPDRPSSELRKAEMRLDLPPLKGQRNKRYVVLIQDLTPVAVLSGDTPIGSKAKIGEIYGERGEEITFERDARKPFRFIHNGKLFALPETLPDHPQ